MKVLVKTIDSVEVRKVKNIDDLFTKNADTGLLADELPGKKNLYFTMMYKSNYGVQHNNYSLQVSIEVAPMIVFFRLRRKTPLIGKKFSWLDYKKPTTKDITYVKEINCDRMIEWAMQKEIMRLEGMLIDTREKFFNILKEWSR